LLCLTHQTHLAHSTAAIAGRRNQPSL